MIAKIRTLLGRLADWLAGPEGATTEDIEEYL